MRGKLRGGNFVTEVAYQELFDLLLSNDKVVGNENNHLLLQNVSVINVGEGRIHVVINNGDELPIDSGEKIVLGDLGIISIIIVEEGANVELRGIERKGGM